MKDIIIHSRNKEKGTVRYTIVATSTSPNIQNGEVETQKYGYTCGVALCGKKEQFNSKKGRGIAKDRARGPWALAYVEDINELFSRQEEIVETFKEFLKKRDIKNKQNDIL
jgi:hypothetical protein